MQILLNFLSNAIKFTDTGRNITVRVKLLDIQLMNNNQLDNRELSSLRDLQPVQENYIKFSLEVEDQGIGISEQNLGKLFIDFGKLQEHEKINPSGTGLGLSICKRIIDQMGFSIKVKSKISVGTTFTVDICTYFKMDEPIQQEIQNDQRSLRVYSSCISIKNQSMFSGMISRQSF